MSFPMPSAREQFFCHSGLVTHMFSFITPELHYTSRISKFCAQACAGQLLYLMQQDFVRGLGPEAYTSLIERVVHISESELKPLPPTLKNPYRILRKKLFRHILMNARHQKIMQPVVELQKHLSWEEFYVIHLSRLIPEARPNDQLKSNTSATSLTPQSSINDAFERIWKSLFTIGIFVPINQRSAVEKCDKSEKCDTIKKRNESVSKSTVRTARIININRHDVSQLISRIAKEAFLYFDMKVQLRAIFNDLRDRFLRLNGADNVEAIRRDIRSQPLVVSCSEYIQKETDIKLINAGGAIRRYLGHISQLHTTLSAWVKNERDYCSSRMLSVKISHIGALPPAIGCFTRLESLTLNNFGLITLPHEIGDCVNLRILNLNNNSLAILPESLGNLRKLHKLKVANNRLRTLPKQIKELVELFFLDIRNNPNFTLPKEVVELPFISVIRIDNVSDEIERMRDLRLSRDTERRIRRAIMGFDEENDPHQMGVLDIFAELEKIGKESS